ncbi:hypothetical protein Cflav_PD4338 [Pedosphaera parvula Ellin514]|uniref:Uncharacterized protein n=1 Tax=Pedosphaera parvula (strain Ellin514) TaxID=320771 RepID=B9XFF3_PEDPL|nr:hypothetical protein Cflav_PD4338 [Pedosphaera parvula Ellin514]
MLAVCNSLFKLFCYYFASVVNLVLLLACKLQL